MNITLRRALIEDSKMILDWRNESTTIPWMGSAQSLSFNEHDNWFKKTLNDPNCIFLIIESNSKPVGQIRFHLDSSDNNYARVSINITQKMHGKGIASLAFSKGNTLVKEIGFASKIFAHVRQDNIGSIKAMENAGYEKTSNIEKHGVKHLVMQYTINAET
ncbi:MAG: hypothetical protein CXT78_03045 [Thaumarchaeota archaeon]|jgi:spore coat polysaccharide biosynthesis protein SpsF|nr:MAG: hypothetical protein CXT78_03045 [Nitrososphaerota archaeon]